MVQLMLALEKASVAAANIEISVLRQDGGDDVLLVWFTLEVVEGISFGSWVLVFDAGSSSGGGVAGGVGGSLGFSGDVIGTSSVCSDGREACLMERKLSNPLRLGIRNEYAIGSLAACGRDNSCSRISDELAIYHRKEYLLAAFSQGVEKNIFEQTT